MASDSARLHALLRRVIPFRFLTETQRNALLPRLSLVTFTAGENIIRQGDPDDTDVYILESGLLEIYDEREGTERRVTLVEPDHYVGEWEPLFDVPRFYSIRSVERSVCCVIPGEEFLNLLETARPVAHSLGVILRDQQGVFAAFERFKVELMRGIGKGYITLAQLLRLYRSLEPAIHPLAASATIDTDALAYVVRRLPSNVTRTFAYLLTDEIPSVYRDPDRLFPKITTQARRRDIWETLPGSSLVLLRNGISDLVDLISCLCLYAVEAGKIRARIDDPEAVRLVKDWANGRINQAEAARTLPFSPDEVAGLEQIWGGALPSRLFEIAKHRETFAITVRRHAEGYNIRRTELWTNQLARACTELLGCDPSELDPDYPVHIISSNTHSVSNCLNAWYTEHRDDILEWGDSTRHPFYALEWRDPYNRLYALARDYLEAHPGAVAELQHAEREQGILRLTETASTGIQVQLIDTGHVCKTAVDPALARNSTHRPGLIVNIDYAFGEQAEHILRNLLFLFGANVSSVSLLGKAGGLVGNRGDILIPTAFVEQSGDRYYAMPRHFTSELAHTADELQARLETGTVHAGPMLTVDGTLLQNRLMLRFYRHIWRCIGMEMEGAYYFRQFLEAESAGLITDDVAVGFYYYVSDVPLTPRQTLAARLHPAEGVPPLYATTRQVLASILER
jgi:CRP-like cAMP-binding protein